MTQTAYDRWALIAPISLTIESQYRTSTFLPGLHFLQPILEQSSLSLTLTHQFSISGNHRRSQILLCPQAHSLLVKVSFGARRYFMPHSSYILRYQSLPHRSELEPGEKNKLSRSLIKHVPSGWPKISINLMLLFSRSSRCTPIVYFTRGNPNDNSFSPPSSTFLATKIFSLLRLSSHIGLLFYSSQLVLGRGVALVSLKATVPHHNQIL